MQLEEAEEDLLYYNRFLTREWKGHISKFKFFVWFYKQVHVEKYFQQLTDILEQEKISSRIKFMIQDVVELRKVRKPFKCGIANSNEIKSVELL